MNTHDQRLINEVARVWVEGGGDGLTFFWNWVQIKRTITEMANVKYLEQKNNKKPDGNGG